MGNGIVLLVLLALLAVQPPVNGQAAFRSRQTSTTPQSDDLSSDGPSETLHGSTQDSESTSEVPVHPGDQHNQRTDASSRVTPSTLAGTSSARMPVNASAATITTINGCLLAERGSWYNYDRSAVAIDLALDYVNSQILQPIGMQLILTFRDIGSKCEAKNHAVTYAMDLIYKGIHCDAILGAGCAYDFESLYDLASFLRIPLIACPAAGVGANANITLYDNMARLSATHLNTVRVIMNFLKWYNYSTPTVIEDQDVSFYQQLSMIAESTFQNTNLRLYTATNFVQIKSMQLTTNQITTYLKDAITQSRAFVLLTNASTTRQIMLVAHDLGLINGDYVFMAVELFSSTNWGTFTWQNGDTFDQAARKAYEVLLLVALTPSVNSEFDVFEDQVKALAPLRPTYKFTYAGDDHVDLVTAHFYDAIVFYGSIIRDMWLNGSDIFLVENFIAWAANYSFESPIQGTVMLDANADRISSYVVRTFNTKSGLFDSAFSVSPSGTAVTALGPYVWPNRDDLPPNAPPCGYDGKNPACAPKPLASGIVATAAIIPTLILLAGGIAASIYIRRIIHKSQDPFWWRVFSHELTGVTENSAVSRASQLNSAVGSRFQSKSRKSVGDDVDDDKAKNEDADRTHLAFVLYGKSAYFRDVTVALRELPLPLQRLSSGSNDELAALRAIKHYNLQDFYGIAINDENLCEFVLGEVCQKGSLMALLEKTSMSLDWQFKHSIMKGIAAGMTYLHTTKVVSHGDLSAHTVLIDSRFVIKISDYGLTFFRPAEDLVPPQEDDEDRDFARLLWRAPELLRRPVLGGTQKGDVYSYGILLQQLILRSAPYESSVESQRSDYLAHAKDLVMEVKKGVSPPQRPMVPVSACPGPLHALLEMCWDEHAAIRITFARIRELLGKILGKSGENIIEHLINRMDVYATELEHEAAEQMRMFLAEKERSEELLKGMLPKMISDKLRRGEMVYPEVYESTTVQFSDIGGFGEVLEAAPTPYVTIDIMNSLYGLCDHVIEGFDVYKVETVNDCYLLVSGLPVKNGIKHAGEMATLALTLRKDVAQLTFPSSPDAKLRLRVGINSGPCVASVVGLKMPKYCLFGDTVNTASRMESHGEAGKIHLSPTTAALLEKLGDYFMSPRGEITVKGKGLMETHWLIAKTSV